MITIQNGVWPTMITPFTEDGALDLEKIPQMVNWYVSRGCAGVFAVCQSSEMYALSLNERVRLAEAVVEAANGRLGVIASGHISDDMQEQVREMRAMAQTGIQALVLVNNHLARQGMPDCVWKENAQRLMDALPPDMPLGIYECPVPYKRLMTPELLNWCAETGRFAFLKDTSCDTEQIREKIEATRGSNLKIFNANSATLLETLRLGAAGFSGVMGNFHPELYVWLCRHYADQPEQAQLLQALLSIMSGIERQCYPMSGKYHMRLSGVDMQLKCRPGADKPFEYAARLEVEQALLLEDYARKTLGIEI